MCVCIKMHKMQITCGWTKIATQVFLKVNYSSRKAENMDENRWKYENLFYLYLFFVWRVLICCLCFMHNCFSAWVFSFMTSSNQQYCSMKMSMLLDFLVYKALKVWWKCFFNQNMTQHIKHIDSMSLKHVYKIYIYIYRKTKREKQRETGREERGERVGKIHRRPPVPEPLFK